jgi:DNA-binding transcriptional LysR family regulator
LTPTVHPGDFVVLDQLVDRTWGRPDTYYDAGLAHHVSFADPYCPVVAAAAADAGRRVGVTIHERGTVVVIQGPRFSTRAESSWFRAQSWEVVNMTQYPEAYLARELGMHYAGIALVTDYDTGVEHDPGVDAVTQDRVFGFFEENLHRIAPAARSDARLRRGTGARAALGPLRPTNLVPSLPRARSSGTLRGSPPSPTCVPRVPPRKEALMRRSPRVVSRGWRVGRR